MGYREKEIVANLAEVEQNNNVPKVIYSIFSMM